MSDRRLLNIRRMFIADPGHVIVDADLAGADARVFAWELGEMFGYSKLKQHMLTGVAIHAESNRFIFPTLCGPDGRAEPYYTEVKSGFFGTMYAGGVRTLSENLAWPEHRTREFQQHIFKRFPEIRDYHRRVEMQLSQTREMWTRFGYSIHYFGEIRSLLPEAVAWLPQATVANVCMYGALALRNRFEPKLLRILLQVHDSLIFQVPLYALGILHEVRSILNSITVPYKDPLRIPWTFKWHGRSWGEVTTIDWAQVPGGEVGAQISRLVEGVPKVYVGE
jgi:DNA polymerase I-like protein with 3'-5' exonuclease and polymerase domains